MTEFAIKRLSLEGGKPAEFDVVGQPVQRIDALGHVTGRSPYYDSLQERDLLHLKMVRSPHHHARILKIDTAPALAVEGVVKVLTHADVPNNVYCILEALGVPADEPVLAADRVLYRGEQICAVIGETPQAAAEGARRVVIDYDAMPAVLELEDVLNPEFPAFKPHGHNYFLFEDHECRRIRFGDIEAGFAEADHIFEHSYQSSPIEHAALETTGCIVSPAENGRYAIHSNTQALFFSLDVTANILGIEPARLHVIGGTVGGGFGGKCDVIVEPICTLAAMRTDRPVKYAYSRQEEMQVSSTRSAERITIRDGVMSDGRIVARKVRMLIDSGAYSRNTPYGTNKAAGHLPGPYAIPNVHGDVYCVYTNRTPTSAMRGFGVTMADYAIEVQMDRIARELEMDPLELRMINAYRDGDMKAIRKKVTGAALVETMRAAAELAGHALPAGYDGMSSKHRDENHG